MAYRILLVCFLILLSQRTEDFHLMLNASNENLDIFTYKYKDGSIEFTIEKESVFLHDARKHSRQYFSKSDIEMKILKSYSDFKKKSAEIRSKDITKENIYIRPNKDYFRNFFIYKKLDDCYLRYEVEWLGVSID